MKLLLGLFVGALCGLAPLAFGFLTKYKLLGIIGLLMSSASGVLFSFLDKSPFTAIGVAIVFSVLMFAKNKKRNVVNDHEDIDIFIDEE